ncbi:MAG: methyl-accepting chemotaxis protein [Candidatus Polarisedimenticolaceae bacterium]|nr:methyl-accepting chemotaxis protein [Candidatus Polarisedimenticolaceae bacterium]
MKDNNAGLFSNLRLRTKIGFSFALMLLVLVSAVSVTIYQVGQIKFLSDRVAHLRTPTTEASLGMLSGINQSLAGLRGWMLLGNPTFKDVRAKSWDEWIDPGIDEMDELSKNWTNAENIKRLKSMKSDLEKFRRFQQEIEDIAQTEDENPALKILFNDAAPRGSKMASLITKLIDLEAAREGSDLRKSILYMMADIRGTTGLGLAAIRGYLISGDEQFRQRFETLWAKNERRFNDLNGAYRHLSPEQQSIFVSFKSVRDEFKVLPPKMFKIRSKADWNVPNYWLATKAAPLADSIEATLVDMVVNQKVLLNSDTEEVATLVAQLETIEYILLFAGFLVTLSLLLMVNNVIIRPITNVAEVVRTIATEQDLRIKVPVASNDEVGQMSEGLNNMLEVIRNSFGVVGGAADKVSESSADVAGRATANRERAGQELARAKTSSKVISEMGATAGQVSEATQAQLDAAQNSQGKVVELLEKMKQVAETSDASKHEVNETLTRVGEMGETGAKVVQTAQSQGEMVTKVTTSIDEMVSSMGQMQQAVDKATEFGRSSLEAAEEGHSSISATVKGMENISGSSEQIAEIIDVITEIAEQTNLLALNAAVEAARAGAHGKGFAVVADEVGKLAQRSSEAAKEITQLIKDSTANVAAGVKLTDQSQQALVRIDEGGRINMQAIEEISNATGGLSSAAQQVQGLMEELNTLAKEIGEMAGEQGTRRVAAQQALETLAKYSTQIGGLVEETNTSVQFINEQMNGIVSRSNEMNQMTALQAQRSKAVSKLSNESAQAAEQTVKGAGAVVGITENLQDQSKSLTEQVQQFKI